MSTFLRKSQGHMTRVNLEHFALFYTVPGIEVDSPFNVIRGEGGKDGFIDLVWEYGDILSYRSHKPLYES